MIPPRVSVIVPMFNAGAFVGRCLESLRTQPMRDWEAVVVDDGSTDDGARIVRAAAADDPRIRLIQQQNLGLPAARNAGIESARAPWLRFIDADDWATPGGLEHLLTLAETHRAELVCGAAAYHDEAGDSLCWSFRPGVSRVTLEMLLEAHRFQVSAAMIRRDALAELRFAPGTQGSEDLDLWLRLGERGFAWHTTDDAVVAYRLRPSGMSRDHTMMARVHARVVGASFARTPRLEAAEPGKRRRCLRRIALERATALSSTGLTTPDAALTLWRSLRPDPAPVTPGEAAAAAVWSIPNAHCRPPTQWLEDTDATRYARCASALWRALEADGLGTQNLESSAVDALAALLVEPRQVADEIVRRLNARSATCAVVLGLGRNAAALVPPLVRSGVRVLGYDDALNLGQRVMVGGEAVDVTHPDAWPEHAVHVLCPNNADRLALAIPGPARQRAIKWTEITTDISSTQRHRLRSLWPCPSFRQMSEVTA